MFESNTISPVSSLRDWVMVLIVGITGSKGFFIPCSKFGFFLVIAYEMEKANLAFGYFHGVVQEVFIQFRLGQSYRFPVKLKKEPCRIFRSNFAVVCNGYDQLAIFLR